MNTKIYLAGDMLPKASQLLRAQEREQIKEIGLDLYNPMDNKEINDKSKVENEGLAERIVKADTDAIIGSNVVVLEYRPFALGTITELGQIKGMKDTARMILNIVKDKGSSAASLLQIIELTKRIEEQKVYPHYEDIRRFEGAGKDEEGDRRSLGINQYIYGVCLDLTDGKGFYEWDEVLEELRNLKK